MVSIVAMVVSATFVSRTKTGKSMRAVAEDQEIASLMGIDVDRIVVTTFVIGGILAGIAGVLFALMFEQVNSFMGFRPGIAAFTAAVLGRHRQHRRRRARRLPPRPPAIGGTRRCS